MSQTILVGYDGSRNADGALDFAAGVARTEGLGLLIVHVLEWSPYTFLTPTEIEERHRRRNEELARVHEHILEPAKARVEGDGLEVGTVAKYGHIAETLKKVATEQGARQMIIGRTGQSAISARLFGSVAGNLAQDAPVPLTIVP